MQISHSGWSTIGRNHARHRSNGRSQTQTSLLFVPQGVQAPRGGANRSQPLSQRCAVSLEVEKGILHLQGFPSGAGHGHASHGHAHPKAHPSIRDVIIVIVITLRGQRIGAQRPQGAQLEFRRLAGDERHVIFRHGQGTPTTGNLASAFLGTNGTIRGLRTCLEVKSGSTTRLEGVQAVRIAIVGTSGLHELRHGLKPIGIEADGVRARSQK
mmetsp:Transcript_21014/g.35096  ORF Transcript_21014/g.35096 Transcript_21014/m.35096 type:complete len:212 (-) Transcript_21014:208-843(-)